MQSHRGETQSHRYFEFLCSLSYKKLQQFWVTKDEAQTEKSEKERKGTWETEKRTKRACKKQYNIDRQSP